MESTRLSRWLHILSSIMSWYAIVVMATPIFSSIGAPSMIVVPLSFLVRIWGIPYPLIYPFALALFVIGFYLEKRASGSEEAPPSPRRSRKVYGFIGIAVLIVIGPYLPTLLSGGAAPSTSRILYLLLVLISLSLVIVSVISSKPPVAKSDVGSKTSSSSFS